MLLSAIFALVVAVIFVIVIIFNRTCYTVPMMLVANSCATEVMFASVMCSMAGFTLRNDLNRIQYQDPFCVSRGFMGYVVTFLQNYSYLLQAIHRYITVVHSNRIFWQSARFQGFLICLTWVCGFICTIPYVITGEIKYNVDNQICQMPLQLSFLMIYNALCVYLIPVSLIMLIYLKLVLHVREASRQIIPTNASLRLKRELKMVRRIVILVMGITTIGFPYALFIFISFFTSPPTYHFRIAYIFVDASLVFVMSAMFQFTEPVKTLIMRKIDERANTIFPAATWIVRTSDTPRDRIFHVVFFSWCSKLDIMMSRNVHSGCLIYAAPLGWNCKNQAESITLDRIPARFINI